MKLAIVGATGLVGKVLIDVLTERHMDISHLIPVASEKSYGKQITYKDTNYSIVSNEEAIKQKPDIAIFSAGGNTSLDWAPKYAQVGTTVIDNSSAWRMSPTNKLIVPEINASTLTSNDKIIANPNCSTIQMVLALAPLHKIFGLKRIIISTYQSYTGTGIKAVNQYNSERLTNQYNEKESAYPYPIFANCIPHCDTFTENGYTKEEMKMINETKKILNDPSIQITATAVRVPVDGGHSESINIELQKPFEMKEIRQTLDNYPGITVIDNISQNLYPMPLFAKNKDDVFVGRIRRDHSVDNGINLWIVSDNLRKGAATNAVQIAEYILENQLL